MVWNVAGNIKGPPGSTGAQGPQGPQGAAGPVGPAGLTWRGAWSNANSYEENDAVSWGGSAYFATADHAALADEPPTGTTADPGTNDTAVNAGWGLLSVQGATGPQGPQGTAGAAGATGAQGPQGPTGPQGPAGADGAAGATGPTGATGATGARGTNWYTGNGAPGTIGGALAGDKYLDLDTGDVYTLS